VSGQSDHSPLYSSGGFLIAVVFATMFFGNHINSFLLDIDTTAFKIFLNLMYKKLVPEINF